MEKFLGIYYFIWIMVCMTVAILYFRFTPKAIKNPDLPKMTRWILKYFHSLVWILLAIACVLANFKFITLAKIMALLSLCVYLVFMMTLGKTKLAKKKTK